MSDPDLQQTGRSLSGIFYLLPAYLVWGLSPVFWKLLSHVPAFELLVHRTLWSLIFLLGIIFMQKRFNELVLIVKKPVYFLILLISTLVLGFNWYLYIWAVNHGQVLQASLGYYINPLLMVILGICFLKEKLRKFQMAALIIALLGVLYYTIGLGQFPWIAVAIAVSFGIYGLIHKLIPVLPLPGLCMETLILSLPSIAYLFWLEIKGAGAMFHVSFSTDILLVATCLVTGLPLLFFTIGTKRSHMTTVGFMQYIAPCCSFLLAVFLYKEPFSKEKLFTFIMIWIALALYSLDSLYYHKDKITRAYKSNKIKLPHK
ncbi:MAG: EamA family transporter RarD [Desulfobacteraceae bacterium]|nr:EamA family transporter RarD [Desulfobacteraceae bacterium]